MLHNASKTIAWVHMHSLGPIYQKLENAQRRSAQFVMNDYRQTSSQ